MNLYKQGISLFLLLIWGITGNAYFFDKILIIDYKKQLFRVY